MGQVQSKDSATVNWFTSPETTPRKTAPCEAFVTFVAKNFKPPAKFLDIGSGSGANARYLEDQGFEVFSIDIAPAAAAHGARFHAIADISQIRNGVWDQFDCIFDIETLQHVEDPPYEDIYKVLKPGGKFFSIHIADDSKVNVAGKGYTRLADVLTMRQLMGRGFMRFSIHKTTNWNGDTKATAWQIEADK